MMLVAKARAILKKSGTLLLSNIGIVSKMAPTLIKIKKKS
jgi:hypothetical protein